MHNCPMAEAKAPCEGNCVHGDALFGKIPLITMAASVGACAVQTLSCASSGCRQSTWRAATEGAKIATLVFEKIWRFRKRKRARYAWGATTVWFPTLPNAATRSAPCVLRSNGGPSRRIPCPQFTGFTETTTSGKHNTRKTTRLTWLRARKPTMSSSGKRRSAATRRRALCAARICTMPQTIHGDNPAFSL